MPYDILPYNLSDLPLSDLTLIIQYLWFKPNAKATIFFSESMTQPKHSIITRSDNKWMFHQGHSIQSKSKHKEPIQIPLPENITDLEELLDSNKLVKGWQNSKTIKQNIHAADTFEIVAR